MSDTPTTTAQALSSVYPLGSRLNERGRLEIGGCDAIELAREFGTPAYVVAEDDLRGRARSFVRAARASAYPELGVVFASKAFPCTAVLRLFAQEGLWCDAASAGELHLALSAGFDPKRIVLHGNAKSEQELSMALDRGVGTVVLDNFDELALLGRLLGERSDTATTQDVLIRVTPDVRGETHEKISTGQADSKFGFSMKSAPEAIARANAAPGLNLRGLHAHIGSQLLELEPFRRAAAQLATLGEFDTWDVGGGLGVRYLNSQPEPPAIADYVRTVTEAAAEAGHAPKRLLIEPGRSLCANSAVTLYSVQSVKQNVSCWVAVDGGMSDNLRPMLYGSVYEAEIADRFSNGNGNGDGDGEPCVLTGKHCESGDVIVAKANLRDPALGDIVVTPCTGAYGHAMANNYNGVPRAPVIFCRDGEARVVLRRETLDDLKARDVD
ncbi:MAG TPA: diaminopimelate decarboxylase [Solirubrobacteraceae bacterium]|jgi:diaminopimelate decarboxylase